MSRIRILGLTDIHQGANASIMQDEVFIEGTEKSGPMIIQANSEQKYLYQKWCDMLDEVRTVDGLFVLGDCIDGPNAKELGAGLWTTNISVQKQNSVELLKMIKVRKKNIYGVDGSPYHVGANPSWDGDVINSLQGKFDVSHTVDVEGFRIHLNHWTGYSKALGSQSTSAAGERAWASINSKWYGKYDLLLRGHTHKWSDEADIFGHTIVVPSWKLLDKHMKRSGLRGQPPQCGYVLLTIRDGKLTEVVNNVWIAPQQHLVREYCI